MSRLKGITSVVENWKGEILNVVGAARVFEGFSIDGSMEAKHHCI